MTPTLLALDTSTDLLAAALLTPAGEWCLNETGGQLSSTRLIPALLALLAQGGVTLADVQAIGFGQGPGAFTGLRTACAVTQGLAFAGNTPVLAIDSLLIVAEDARAQAAPGPDHAPAGAKPASGLSAAVATDWWVAMDARMDEIYAACYQFSDAGWQVLEPPRLWTLPALAAHWAQRPPQCVAGSAITAFAGRLPWAQAALWPDSSNRAAALLRLAQAAWAQGSAIQAEHALPLYLRDKVALTTAERLQLRAASA